MTFNDSAPTDKDRVRALIGDTSNTAATEFLTDNEIANIFLPLAGSNVFGAAAMACLAIAGNRARSAIAWDVLGRDFAVDKRSVPREFRLLAVLLREQANDQTDPDSIVWTDQNMVELLDGMVQGGLKDFQHLEE